MTTAAVTPLRRRGRHGRFYADLRRYSRFGGRYEALIPPGERYATIDRDVALKLLATRLTALEEARRRAHLLGLPRTVTVEEGAARYLVAKREAGRVSFQTIMSNEQHLRRFITFCGEHRWIDEITTGDFVQFDAYLRTLPGTRGRTLSGQTRRHHFNTLSGLFKYLQSEGVVPPGYNPVALMANKPTAEPSEARWLEVHEAALYLEAARRNEAKRSDLAISFTHPLIATLLLTGGRWREVAGLEVSDVSFERGTVRFRPNEHRGLKTKTSDRSVPLHPQLREILVEYRANYARTSGLLFPSPRLPDRMITDIRKSLDAIGERIGWEVGSVRTRLFRHTYCAARLQTLDGGHPIATYTVARELGHGGEGLIKRVYGHLGTVRHRSEHVEFRVEQHADRDEVRDRLRRLAAPR